MSNVNSQQFFAGILNDFLIKFDAVANDVFLSR